MEGWDAPSTMLRSLLLLLALLGVAEGGHDVAPSQEVDRPYLTSMFLLDKTLAAKAGKGAPAEGRGQSKAVLASLVDPSSSPAHRRGAFSDMLAAPAGPGHRQQLRAFGSTPQPPPLSAVPPLELETADGGSVTLGGPQGDGRSFLVSVYYDDPQRSKLWTEGWLDHLPKALPAGTHLVLAASGSAKDPEGAMRAMRQRLEGSEGYGEIKDRVHFVREPIGLSCTADVFPNCPEGKHGWLAQAVNGWGTINPTLTASWGDGGETETLDMREAVGDSGGWLKPVTLEAKENGGKLDLELAVWGGEACDVAEHAANDLKGKIVLVERGTCTFYTKVRNAAAKGARAVLVQNGKNRALHRMSCGAPDDCGRRLGISAVLVPKETGAKLAELAAKESGSGGVSVSLSTALQGEYLIGVDSRGRLREIGRVPPVGVSRVHAWHFIALEAVYWEYQRGREEAHDDPEALRVEIYGGKGAESKVLGGGAGLTSLVKLPPASEMAGYDSMALHAKLDCPSPAEKSCGAWDYVVRLMHCGRHGEEEGRKDGGCDVEFGRWVTAYGRPGEWSSDATALLPLMRKGGVHKFLLSQPEWSQQRYRPTVTLVLTRKGKGTEEDAVPAASTFLFDGGAFDAGYNTLPSHAPLRVSIPHDAAKVEIHAVVSGHGWGSTEENCAEFCVSQHRFGVRPALQVDDQTYVGPEEGLYTETLSGAGDGLGCSGKAEVLRGVTPNQYGTWQYGRAGWCPGGGVRPWVVDVTESVRPGMDLIVSYKGLVNGTDYKPSQCQGDACGDGGTGPTISMQSFLVVYKRGADAGGEGGAGLRAVALMQTEADGGGGTAEDRGWATVGAAACALVAAAVVWNRRSQREYAWIV